MAACLLVVLGDGLAAAASHLSMALGAFVAGLLLAETEYRREIELTIEPFRGLLLGLYFVSVGAGINPAFICRATRSRPRPRGGADRDQGSRRFSRSDADSVCRPAAAAEMSLLLGPGGEFGFVMIGVALAGGLIDRTACDDADQRGRRYRCLQFPRSRSSARASAQLRRGRGKAPEVPPDSEQSRVIIVGYGRVGALIGDMLDRHAIPFIAVDANAGVTARARADGKPVYYGDASRPEYLRLCGLETARAVVVTMDAPKANEAVVETTRSLRPERDAGRPRPRRRSRPRALWAWRDRRGARDRSRRACSSQRLCWSTSACRWDWSSPRSTRSATSSASCSPSPARPSARARHAARDGGDGSRREAVGKPSFIMPIGPH